MPLRRARQCRKFGDVSPLGAAPLTTTAATRTSLFVNDQLGVATLDANKPSLLCVVGRLAAVAKRYCPSLLVYIRRCR